MVIHSGHHSLLVRRDAIKLRKWLALSALLLAGSEHAAQDTAATANEAVTASDQSAEASANKAAAEAKEAARNAAEAAKLAAQSG